MQRPRHSSFARVAIKLGLLLLVVVALGACREDRGGSDRSAADYQRRLDASGKRVLVVDPGGDPVAKLRKRTTQYKVYDETLAPVGFVAWSTDDNGEPTVHVRAIDGERRPVERVSEGKFELGDDLRLERTDAGWAVFGPESKLVGVFQRRDEHWKLRLGDDGPTVAAEADAGQWTVSEDGKPVLEVRSTAVSEVEVLALKLDGLPMLYRVAVGAWMQRARPDRLPAEQNDQNDQND